MTRPVRWGDVAAAEPDLADAARSLLYQYGVGLAFLGTVRADGGPRLHPFCPILDGEGLYGFIVASPKRDDLHRDARYALHSFPADENEDAFAATGPAALVDDPDVRHRLEARFRNERPRATVDLGEQELFEFLIERCLLTRSTGHGDPSPEHLVWKAP